MRCVSSVSLYACRSRVHKGEGVDLAIHWRMYLTITIGERKMLNHSGE